MALLVNAQKISKSFGLKQLFEDISFSIESSQKIGLIGPNGAGKSTLFKILSKQTKPDSGELSFSQSLRIAYLEQTPILDLNAKIFEYILQQSDDIYETQNIQLTQSLIAKLELDQFEDQAISTLSGGWKKRVALACQLIKKPNLLLLDEPTNHLDIASIQWLESFLESQNDLACFMITHDRLFLQNTCDIIFDLDKRNPSGLIQFKGVYSDFLELKDSQIQAQQQLESSLSNTLRRETQWLRRGAKARQTKQKARIERAGQLKDDVQNLTEKNRNQKIQIDFGDIQRTPKKLIECQAISKSFSGKNLFQNFSYTLGARARVGIIGPNGCGKSSLIKCLIGEEPVDTGKVWISDQVSYSYFEQNRQSLDPNLSVIKNICPEGDYVQVQGQSIYVKSYLSRFNFRPDQMEQPVSRLSGGEQSRLLIARLMMQKVPILILDEPTNDLDIDSLNVLEQALQNFDGAVILVTHDRYFMDQVVNQILAIHPITKEILSFADYLQWQAFDAELKTEVQSLQGKDSALTNFPKKAETKKARLSFKEKFEFENMESNIQSAEDKLQEIQNQLNQTSSSDYLSLQELSQKLEAQQKTIHELYERWQILTEKQNQ